MVHRGTDNNSWGCQLRVISRAEAFHGKHEQPGIRREQGMARVPEAVRRMVPAMVADELDTLSDAQQSAWLEEFERRAKKPALAYVCLVLCGVHYAYFGRWVLQLLFWGTLGGFFLWWIADIFRVPGLIRDANRDVAVAVLRDLRAVSRGA
jgi:hypothetical protein